jgi:hypothetical protein
MAASWTRPHVAALVVEPGREHVAPVLEAVATPATTRIFYVPSAQPLHVRRVRGKLDGAECSVIAHAIGLETPWAVTKVHNRMASLEHNQVMKAWAGAVVCIAEMVGGFPEQSDTSEGAFNDLRWRRSVLWTSGDQDELVVGHSRRSPLTNS